MADHNHNSYEDDLAPSLTTGYKVGEKKTLEELAQLDAQDESLKKWKESLGVGAAAALPAGADPRRVIVLALTLEVAGRPDVSIDLSTPDAIKALETNVLTIKEGVEYRLKVTFKIQHDVVSGLKYLHAVKRGPVRVDKTEEMVGSYGPSPEPYTKKFTLEEAPSGMLARGTYTVKSRFIDDDNQAHLEWTWSLAIKKDWE
ncbi:hypothetical protein BASA50_002336 [Batrachochytrium salamandrivorans]|uniref:Rho GDP-dissociation inhibitor n=1 Tax=Batrachochytrium salamandrivorans TaxID=1357716 RepID=A0ABQ8FPH7_9FUNG|nr:hypothetical protein BASA60_011442 [Batrachochytrium salamandrivorans]KAH6577171.1 hypothetical protein BASA62_001007 [Batrachochytrium salamandrivorans]KAH6600402.1 hypothetical protein BASA50_002336 [Batrachochytrium salamandrivorans]KAH6602853.1 hypothetical protein BASA61_000696 [Batrachochytrium salamandrivorans]KAH9263888.1 hypothetical protein BASA83_012672 [Batrachochytrium salamandrivorans]